MNAPKLVGAGAFIVIGAVLFTAAIFMIGERRMLFVDRFTVYTEFASLGQLERGAVVRVGGLDAGEVTDIQIPSAPGERFRVALEVRSDVRPLIRTDSVASTQTEGLVGAVFVNIRPGTAAAPEVPDGGTIPSREPFTMADLLQQTSQTVTQLSETIESLRGDLEDAIQNVALTAEDVHALVETLRPDLLAIAKNGAQISADAREIVSAVNRGEGTLGKLIHDDALYVRAREIADEARAVVENLREVSGEARRAIADFRSQDGPAQGLLGDMRGTVRQAREAMADLADNMEALKRNFFLRGFFNRRGYFDLDELSPAQYRRGVLENGRRKALRIWLGSDVLFQQGADGAEVLTAGGRARLDAAMATFLEYIPANPIVVEGYATEGAVAERYRRGRIRAGIVREYLMGRYELLPQHTGYIGLGSEAQGSPTGETFDGVAITLFLDSDALQFAQQAAARQRDGAP